MSVFGHEGVSAVEQCFIVRRPNGRLFIPHDVFSATVRTRWTFDALMSALEVLPCPIPEDEVHRAGVGTRLPNGGGPMRHMVFNIAATTVVTADPVYTDSWLAWVGYVEPFEQVLTCAQYLEEPVKET